MKKLISTLTFSFLFISSAAFMYVTKVHASVDEYCLNLALEQQIADDEIEGFLADCVLIETDSQQHLQKLVEEECRALAVEQEVSPENLEQYMEDCVIELGPEFDIDDQDTGSDSN